MPTYSGETEKRDAVTEMGIAEDKVFLKSKDDAGFSNTLYMSPESAREMGRYLIGLADLIDPPKTKPVIRDYSVPSGMGTTTEKRGF